MRRLFLISIGAVAAIGIVIFVAVTVNLSGLKQSADIILMTAVVPGCGNDILEGSEQCDGIELAGASCETKGFASGVLSCTRSCLYNTTACVRSSNSGGGGGGGSSSGATVTGTTNSAQVVLVGRAYPNRTVTILKDAQIVATTVADAAANFQVTVSGLAAGTYRFSLSAVDVKGVRSSSITVPVMLTKGILNKVDTIFIPPTLSSDKVQVKQGDKIVFSGQSVPVADVAIALQPSQRLLGHVKTGTDGTYSYAFDTTALATGPQVVKAFVTSNRVLSPQSNALTFAVGGTNILSATSSICAIKGDLNNDCKVNLVDFSIAAFWYQTPLTPAFAAREREHLSGDGKVDITDFSIMAFHWTG